MNTLSCDQVLTDEELAQWQRDGFFIARGLLQEAEAIALRDHFMALHAAGPVPGLFNPRPLSETNGDILKHFPRFMHPHRADKLSFDMMLDARLRPILRDGFGEEPLAAQSMFYFKPPGARGQALHQDNFYLRVQPGNCMAAWLAVDDADRENGGMFVVPGSHQAGVLCPHIADPQQSFTVEEVDVPEGLEPVPVDLKAGDVLFFNGSVIHGSYPNTSPTRFRRAFICHYVPQSLTEMSAGYYPLHTFDGETLTRGASEEGGICGSEEWDALWVARRASGEWSPIQ